MDQARTCRTCEPQVIVGCIPDAKGQVYTRCVHCGEVFGPHDPPFPPTFLLQIPCRLPNDTKIPLQLPSLPTRAVNYWAAWTKFRASGMQVLNFAGVMARFRKCSPCPYYNDAEGACSICGCYVNLVTGGSIANKLEWASEACPKIPPEWNSEPPRSI